MKKSPTQPHPIAVLRNLAGMAGRDFAPLIGIAYPRLIAIESGRLRLPRAAGLRIALLFGVDERSLSGERDLRAWDGTTLTASKIAEYLSRPYDEHHFKEAWERPMQQQLLALVEAAAADRQKSRVVLAEFTNWIEGIRQSLGLADATQQALLFADVAVLKRHIETNILALRQFYFDQEIEKKFPGYDLSGQWRGLEKKEWSGTTRATVIEEIRPLWSPLLDPDVPRGDRPPVDGPVWKFFWELQIFVSSEFAGTISSVHAIPTARPLEGGLGWTEPVSPAPTAPRPEPKSTGRRIHRITPPDDDDGNA